MRYRVTKRHLTIFGPLAVVRALSAALFPLPRSYAIPASEWRYYSSVSNEVHDLTVQQADSLLIAFCETPVRLSSHHRLTCTARQLGSAFSDILDGNFRPRGVILGHFLGPESDDAAISGSSFETHPSLWGGTLLLTRQARGWIPVWYHSRMITDICQKVVLPDHRDILLCEDEDSQMGHAFHDLYSIDLKRPAEREQNLLAEADAFGDPCAIQQQVLRPVQWSQNRLRITVEVDTIKWKLLNGPDCQCYIQPPESKRLTYTVTMEGLRPF